MLLPPGPHPQEGREGWKPPERCGKTRQEETCALCAVWSAGRKEPSWGSMWSSRGRMGRTGQVQEKRDVRQTRRHAHGTCGFLLYLQQLKEGPQWAQRELKRRTAEEGQGVDSHSRGYGVGGRNQRWDGNCCWISEAQCSQGRRLNPTEKQPWDEPAEWQSLSYVNSGCKQKGNCSPRFLSQCEDCI